MIFSPVIFLNKGVYVKLDAPTGLTADASSGKVSLKWSDPVDLIGLATWKYTRIVRKEGSQPNSAFDGELVVESGTRNQYQATPYVDSDVNNGTQYYYGAFAFSDKDVPSDGAFANATPKAGTPLSELAEGTLIKMNENGAPVEFYVSKINYEEGLNGAGRVLVVRKDCYDNRVWDSGNVNAYASSDLDSWFNSTYKNMLDADIRSLIGTTKIRYSPGNGNTVSTLERSIFALSATELGQSASWFNVEGSSLPIASTLKVAYLNGSANDQWARSPSTDFSRGAVPLYANGYVGREYCNGSYGSRPAFTLPSTISVDENMNVIA